MPTVNLTVRKIKSLKPQDVRREFWDESLKGFGIRITKSGRKTFVLMYRHHRRLRRYTLGTYPKLSLADARRLASELFQKVAGGQDPATEKRLARTAGKTIADLATEYVTRHAKPTKKSWRADKWMLDSEVLPRWRMIHARDISRADVRALVEAIADRGAPILANRVHALLSKMFNFAITRDWRDDNPCFGVTRPGKERRRDRVLTRDELKILWKTLDTFDVYHRAFFQIRILTAQRGGEIKNMRWKDIDESGWWTIPPHFSKNGLPHRVPLSDRVRAILADLKMYQDRRLSEINDGRRKKRWPLKPQTEWVFPSPRGNDEPLEWIQKPAIALRQQSGVEFRPHDLRRTAASMMTASGISRLTVQKILNHAERGVTAVYDRFSYDPDKKQALDAWARLVLAIVEGKQNQNVIPIATGQR